MIQSRLPGADGPEAKKTRLSALDLLSSIVRHASARPLRSLATFINRFPLNGGNYREDARDSHEHGFREAQSRCMDWSEFVLAAKGVCQFA